MTQNYSRAQLNFSGPKFIFANFLGIFKKNNLAAKFLKVDYQRWDMCNFKWCHNFIIFFQGPLKFSSACSRNILEEKINNCFEFLNLKENMFVHNIDLVFNLETAFLSFESYFGSNQKTPYCNLTSNTFK
jgi:hypothetical protein